MTQALTSDESRTDEEHGRQQCDGGVHVSAVAFSTGRGKACDGGAPAVMIAVAVTPITISTAAAAVALSVTAVRSSCVVTVTTEIVAAEAAIFVVTIVTSVVVPAVFAVVASRRIFVHASRETQRRIVGRIREHTYPPPARSETRSGPGHTHAHGLPATAPPPGFTLWRATYRRDWPRPLDVAVAVTLVAATVAVVLDRCAGRVTDGRRTQSGMVCVGAPPRKTRKSPPAPVLLRQVVSNAHAQHHALGHATTAAERTRTDDGRARTSRPHAHGVHRNYIY